MLSRPSCLTLQKMTVPEERKDEKDSLDINSTESTTMWMTAGEGSKWGPQDRFKKHKMIHVPSSEKINVRYEKV
jgi:hypothetical protein